MVKANLSEMQSSDDCLSIEEVLDIASLVDSDPMLDCLV